MIIPLQKGLTRHAIFIRVQPMRIFLRATRRFKESLCFLLGVEVRAVSVLAMRVKGTVITRGFRHRSAYFPFTPLLYHIPFIRHITRTLPDANLLLLLNVFHFPQLIQVPSRFVYVPYSG